MKAIFLKGRLEKLTSTKLDKSRKIKELEQEEVYKYLGVNESNGIQNATMKKKIRKEYYRKVEAILKTELNSAIRIQAINTLTAYSLHTYSFNIINWNLLDIKKMNTKIRKLLTHK